MKRCRITIDGRIYEVEIDDPRARPVTARVSGEVFLVEVDVGGARHMGPAPADPPPDRVAAPANPAAARVAASSTPPPVARTLPTGDPQVLTAPLPGTIMSVVACVGQAVQRGDELLSLEAMKMINVIRSPRAGTIAAVHVTEGKLIS